ncbi:hypothetical protein L195_g013237 [Trifolium pratense]|uniref:Reverse transcriptase zinc-binding domain-containing protein n=1 Tax=Trifolium pratense TaxID=57577 RepID=A0A2K3PML3_TRIPR|nr:hypothetical protein L195_g013237 [Trifolium pratense]
MQEFRPVFQPDATVNWSSIWQIISPPKARHVLWRIYKGCIPMRVRLLCNAELEDGLQSFFTCSLIRDSRAVAGGKEHGWASCYALVQSLGVRGSRGSRLNRCVYRDVMSCRFSRGCVGKDQWAGRAGILEFCQMSPELLYDDFNE